MNKAEPVPSFVAAAEAFHREYGGHMVFRLLGRFMGCSEAERAQLVKALYCQACPENSYDTPEPGWKSRAGLLLLPWAFLCSKRLLWRREAPVDFVFETTEPSYFYSKYAGAYRGLRGSKRLAPRAGFAFPDEDVTEPVASTVRPRDLPGLLLLGLLATPGLWRLQHRTGLRLLKAYRQALSLYVTHRGYFARYPCRDFVTTQDELVHPARTFAFRRECLGELVAVQNGERNEHPLSGFGLVDRYLVFGEAYARILRRVGVQARAWDAVGSPGLDETHARLKPLLDAPQAPRWDVLMLDQGVRPFNGLSPRTGAGLDALVRRFAELAHREPGLRLAYQLRWYDPTGPVREPTIAALREVLGPGMALLPNDGKGESYENCLRARLVLTFQSTLGYEAMLLGRKVLFANFTGDPAETVCPDPRFQLEDPDGGYDRFAAKVKELLALELREVPAVARERNVFDGRMGERIAAALNGREPRPAPAAR